jgi:hypothetical protein
MCFFSIRNSALLIVGFLFSAGAARADYMDWSYHWSISPAPVLASGTGTVSQALGWGGKGSTRLLAAAVTTSSDATTKDPDHFDKSFSLTLHIKDLGAHLSGILTFHGLIYGTLTANSAHLTETFSTPTEHIKLGSHTYYVTLPHEVWLQRPGSPYVPYYYASVRVLNTSPPPHSDPPAVKASAMVSTASIASVPGASTPVASAPEPSGLVLVGLGIALLGGRAGLRRSRRMRT